MFTNILFKQFLVIFVCIPSIMIMGFPQWIQNVKEYQLNRLAQEIEPSIEYKYVIQTLLPHPKNNQWWKRGTHRRYAPQKEGPQIVTP